MRSKLALSLMTLSLLVSSQAYSKTKTDHQALLKETKKFSQCYKSPNIKGRLFCLKNLISPQVTGSVRSQFLVWLGQIEKINSKPIACNKKAVAKVTVVNPNYLYACFSYTQNQATHRAILAYHTHPKVGSPMLENIYAVP